MPAGKDNLELPHCHIFCPLYSRNKSLNDTRLLSKSVFHMNEVSHSQDYTSMISEDVNLRLEICICEIIYRFKDINFSPRTIVLRKSIITDDFHEEFFCRLYITIIREEKIIGNHEKIRTMWPVFNTFLKYCFIGKRDNFTRKSLQAILLNSSEKRSDGFYSSRHSIQLYEVTRLISRICFYHKPSDKRRNDFTEREANSRRENRYKWEKWNEFNRKYHQ